VLHPQGKNVNEPELSALGNMLGSASWQLPQAEEYKNDLVQPAFLSIQPQATSTAIVAQTVKPDPNGPATEGQWTNVNKMVAWFTHLVFRKPIPFPQSAVLCCTIIFRINLF